MNRIALHTYPVFQAAAFNLATLTGMVQKEIQSIEIVAIGK